ncbi:MAG: molybdopterin-dependent oxidoreductase [Acidobacteria bacterium]|nr:molybdopterin-dependent oxidoreductase [Acidobacteriota bacterium]
MTRSHFARDVAAVLLLALVVPAWPLAQAPDRTLSIGGDVATPLTLGVDALKTLPRTTVEVQGDGRTLRYEGVLLAELLARAGVPLGADLRGDAVASYIVASASDGYRAVFSLAEVDPAFTHNDVIVADTVDGKPLFAYQGPVRIVAPKDAREARSVRMLQRIDVVRLKK